MILHIKNMVSLRCKMLVREEIERIGLHFVNVDLGWVEILEDISTQDYSKLNLNLQKSGLKLLDDNQSILIERIKNVIIEMVHHSDEIPKVNYSDFLSEKLNLDYTYLSNMFSEVQQTTIQNFIITHKIERAKELLIYDELSLSEIANKLNYSSCGHLSNQFKKVTGISPSYFKLLKDKQRQYLENI